MKRFLLLTVMCVLGLFTLKAQETTFSYDFNDGSMAGWRVFQGSMQATAPNWAVTSDGDTYYSGYENSRCVYSCSYINSCLLPYNYIVTENAYQITENTVLSWFVRHTYANGTYENFDPYQVVISEDNNTFTPIWDGAYVNGENEKQISLAEHAGKTLYIGFYHYYQGCGDAICIDNIVLSAGGGEEPDPTPGEGEIEFAYNFDDGTFTGWRTWNAEGAYCLGWQTNPDDPYGVMGPYYSGTDGTYCAVSISSDPMMGTLYKPNSYLVTENAYLMTSTSMLTWNVKFPFSNGNGPDYYELVVSTDNETFTSIWSEQQYAIETMQPREFDLSEYAGQNLYVGFRHYRETSNSNAGFICIDDVVLSAEGSDIPQPTAPAKPVNLFAEAEGTSITLTWDAVEGATSYNVYSYLENIATVTEPTFTITDLTANARYCYNVTAVNAAGESEFSSEACADTEEPVNPNPTPGENTLVTLGSGSQTFGSIPTDTWFGYSKTQQIYTAEELAAAGLTAGKINSIAFKTSGPYTTDRNVVVYMLNTDKAALTPNSSNAYFEAVTAEDIVFEGTFSIAGIDQWCTMELATPFEYTGGNILVYVVDNSNAYEGGSNQFYVYAATNGAVYEHQDGLQFDPYASGQGILAHYKNQVQFGVEGGENPDAEGNVVIVGENGTAQCSNMPINPYYEHSISQQIYTGEELNYTAGNITKIAYYQTAEQIESYTRDVTVYMSNTDKEFFEGDQDWAPVASTDMVFDGQLSTLTEPGLFEIELDTPFAYAGGNLLVTVVDHTGIWKSSVNFQSFLTETNMAYYACNDGNAYDPYNLSVYGNTFNQRNTTYFTIVSEPGISVNPEAISLGNIQLGEYWPEKETASVTVSVAAIQRTVTSITCDNDFFTIPEDIDFAALPIKFTVGYDANATAGEYTGTLTITAEEGDVVEVPMSAVVYSPVEPDVFELAREITFSDDAYTDAPDFTTLYDDYLLPNEGENGFAPDAVYAFSLESDYVVKAEVEGTGGFYAIYKAEDLGNGNGPAATNNYNGEETILETAFTYDFEDGSLADFTIQNLDEYPDYCWNIVDGKLVSKSYDYWGEYGTDTWGTMDQADERIITNEAYTITPYTVLTFDMDELESGTYLNLTVEVTQDGEEFTTVGAAQAHPYYFKEDYMIEYYPELFDENGNYITFRRVDIGAAFIAAGLEYGDYQISLRATNQGGGDLLVDNVMLTERAGVYAAGDYYLVAAAKDAFTLNVELTEVSVEPVKPQAPTNVTAEATGLNSIMVSWDAVEGAMYYGLYKDGEWAVAVATTSYEFTNLQMGTEYCFTVVTITEVDENFVMSVYSDPSEEACATTETTEVLPPSNVTAVATGANSILLSWDPVEGAMGYGIYLFGEWQGGLYPEYTEFEFTSLASNTEYCFSVSAITEIDADGYIVGETEPSEQACATTEEGILPPNVTAEAISDSEIVLSWDAVDGALAYGIYMYGEWLGGTYDTSVTIEGLSPETEYCFTVISVSEIDEEGYIVGYSAESEQACATTKPIGVAEFSTAFNIYPNPANDVLFIENGSNIEQITIYNVTGVMVYDEQCTSNNVQVNVADLEAGVYIIKVRTEHNEVINRFVKK